MRPPLTALTARTPLQHIAAAVGASQDANSDHVVLAMAITKNVVCAAIFALTCSLSKSGTGIVPGVIIVLLIGALSTASFCILGSASAYSLGGDATSLTTEQLWHKTVRTGAGLIGAVILFHACGALVQYTATCAELLGPAVARILSRPARIALVGVALLPLCLAPDLTALRHSSLIGLAGVVYSVAFVCWRALDGSYGVGGRWHGLPNLAGGIVGGAPGAHSTAAGGAGGAALRDATPLFALSWGCVELIGALNTAYTAHLNVPAYWQSWASRPQPPFHLASKAHGGGALSRQVGKFAVVAGTAFAVCALFYVLVLIAGWHTFGSADGETLLLLRYAAADQGAAMMRLATLVSVVCGYPLIFQAVRDVLCTYWLPPRPSVVSQQAVSLMLLIVMTVTALGVDNLSKFIALRGALLGSLLVYTLPAAIGLASWRQMHDESRVGRNRYVEGALIALGVYGVVASAMGTAMVLRH